MSDSLTEVISENKIICGDSIHYMESLPPDCIDLIITSPPYNLSKNYIGYEDNMDLAEYHDWLRTACRAMYRVIRPNANVFVNICDAGVSNRDAKIRKGNRGNFHVIPHHTVVIDEMLKVGAQYLNPILWRKPSNHKAQFGNNPRFCGTYPYPANPHIPSEIEYILHFRKNGVYTKVAKEKKEASKITKERWMQLTSQIWEFHGNNRKDHPATFPIELPLRCIEGWSFSGDLVLDPFMGTGTTALAALQMGRRYLGVEISQHYCEVAKQHLELK